MKIHDLTRGKYPSLYSTTNDFVYAENAKQMAHYSSGFQSLFANNKNDIGALLNNIPVFLVESSMSCEYVSVPGCQCLVQVPEDNYATIVDTEDFDINKWVASKESDIPEKDDPRERTSRGFSITDLLGVYIYKGNHDIMPRRIFIWLDKIMACAERNTKVKAYINDNACALFELVLYHELGHALMDVELYGVHPSPKFSYAKNAPYRFYEEAFANGVALSILMADKHAVASQKPLILQQQSFIENFVKSQGWGYSDGWELYMRHVDNIDQWMGIKVLFNFEIVLFLKAIWKHKPFIETVFEGVGHDGWIAVKDRCDKWDKWSIIELPSQNAVAGFKKYDSFCSFDGNGLCMVRVDQEHGYLYGYVNEQGVEQIPVEYDHLYSFENGITIAKKDGWYGAIDLNNKIVIPFNLPYDDVRGFRNGRAAVKNSAGKWGVIDTNGKEIVPCTNDSIVS